MRFLALFFGVVFVLLGQGHDAAAWDLNDVSILLPLPEVITEPGMLATSDAGSAGELLPQSIITGLPSLSSDMPQAQAYAQLRVVGVRIDPCFPAFDPAHPENCRRQIRLIWQPLLAPVNPEAKATSTIDAGVHTFYDLSVEEFGAFTTALKDIQARSGVPTAGLPLGVHPALVAQGYAGAFWTEVRKLVLSYAGMQRLTRVTFMTSIADDLEPSWHFGAFDIVGGRMQMLQIPRTSVTRQAIGNMVTAIEKSTFACELFPGPEGDDTFNEILTDATKDIAQLRTGLRAIHRIENPAIHNPGTIDCVSCHTAQPARVWATTRFPELDLSSNPFRFDSPGRDLTNQSPGETTPFTNRFRIFGYMGDELALGQRVINESAAVADQLDAR